MVFELVFDLLVLALEHENAFFLVSLIDFFIHGFFLNNLLSDVEGLARALLMQHRSPVCRFQAGI